MKKLLLIVAIFIAAGINKSIAQCASGFSEVIVQIIPDSWPQETTWELIDNSGVVLQSGGSVGDTICVPTGNCIIFNIYDAFGDGIYAPGGYWLYLDGALIATGNSFGSFAQHHIGCPQGMFCSDPIPLQYGTFAAAYDNTFYEFVAPASGTYNITTCGLNACNTKIWVYTSCAGQMLDEGPPGTYAYNDDASCGLLADLDVIFMQGQTYYVRIGDSMDDCPGIVNFTFSYIGPIQGCIDPLACNFNPLATVDDGSCIYFPDPNCAGPDLKFDSLAFASSLSLVNMNAGACDVNEGCVTGYGNRYVIQFTSKIDNIGNLDYIVGNPSTNPGMFNLVNCHGHTHYEGYGDYRLYDVNGDIIPVGHKNGFCVMDLCGWGTYNCGYMGISAGCYDVYGAGTQCQWVDITDVPDGEYRLAVIINAHHLPDAFNKYETNYSNNALQVCIQITRNAVGVPSFSILPNCTPFVDCMGIPGGAAVPDCNGICGGPGIFGNINGDLVLDSLDVQEFTDLLESTPSASTSCNDLNGDGILSVYDAALANWCINTPHNPHPAGSNFNDCNFPVNILNPNDSTGLAISNVNFINGYVDIEMLSTTADIKAYQFSMHGINVTNVISMSDPGEFPVDIRVITGTNEIFALSHQDSVIARSNSPQIICRIYFSAVTDTIICIENIRDIVNQNTERTVTYIYNGCVNTTFSGISNVTGQLPVALIPNPVTGIAHIQLPDDYHIDNVEIIDMTGRIASAAKVDFGKNNEIDLSSLAKGVYQLKIQSEGRTGYVRFSKL